MADVNCCFSVFKDVFMFIMLHIPNIIFKFVK